MKFVMKIELTNIVGGLSRQAKFGFSLHLD